MDAIKVCQGILPSTSNLISVAYNDTARPIGHKVSCKIGAIVLCFSINATHLINLTLRGLKKTFKGLIEATGTC